MTNSFKPLDFFAMNRQSISKLEQILRNRFSKLKGEFGRCLNKNQLLNCIAGEWTNLLEESGCYFLNKGCLVEPVEHPEGFVLVSDPIKTRAIAIPEEFAFKAIVFGEIP